MNGKATEKHRRPGPGNPSGQGKQCPRGSQSATSEPTTHILVLSPRQESSSSPAPVACHGDVSLSQASQGAQPPQPYLAQREVQAGAGYVSPVPSFRQPAGVSALKQAGQCLRNLSCQLMVMTAADGTSSRELFSSPGSCWLHLSIPSSSTQVHGTLSDISA